MAGISIGIAADTRAFASGIKSGVLNPLEDVGTAETELDDTVVTLLNAIDEVRNLRWTTADKRILSETTQAPCYDITLELPYQHNKEA